MDIPSTQRAYTFRLRGPKQSDGCREALWETHEATNKGAQIFGSWLLTLRGGLDHKLVNDLVANPKKGGEEQAPRQPGEDEKRDRRIVLALSWLSVESKSGAPTDKKYLIEKNQLIDALRQVLVARGFTNEIDLWVKCCERALTARIRDDACWVNRSLVFDDLCKSVNEAQAREDAKRVLYHLFSKDYLILPRKQQSTKPNNPASDSETDSASDEGQTEEIRSAAVQSGRGAAQRTRHLFSYIFGKKADSKGFGKPPNQLHLRQWWQEQLRPKVEAAGIPLADSMTDQLEDSHSPTELHREMLSKAAARLAQIHTKQKQQEIERQSRESADHDLRALEANSKYAAAINKLNEFYTSRSPRLRQLEQWERVVRDWAKISEADSVTASEMRIDAAKKLQEELHDEKFGDINLFIALADESFKPTWWHEGNPDASILKTFVRGEKARADAENLKVAAYRHPDPYENPVFCQFGVSRPHIAFRRLGPIKSKDPAATDVRAVEMLLWDGSKAKRRILLASSRRFDREIGSAADLADKKVADSTPVPRRSRLGTFDVNSSSVARVTAVFDSKKIKLREENENDEDGDDEKFKEPSWNGTLQADRQELREIGKWPEKSKNRKQRLHWSLAVSLGLQPSGPWIDYVKGNQQLITPDGKKDAWMLAPKKTKDTWHGTAYPFSHAKNHERRGTISYHVLSSLPKLRVLSVDLGHRFAAACAVWETMSQEDFEKEISTHKVIVGGKDNNSLFLHAQYFDQNGKKRTSIYRRTGPNMWARLDRQFLIKLQGETESPRAALKTEEIERVKVLEAELGYQRNQNNPLPRRIDELMSETVRTCRLGLRYHGDYARIAWGLTADYKPMPGEDKKHFMFQAGDAEEQKNQRAADHIAYLQDMLMLWYNLAISGRWQDDWVLNLWNEKIAPLIANAPFTEPPPLRDKDATDEKKIKRRQQQLTDWRAVWACLQRSLIRQTIEEEEQEQRPEYKANRQAVHALMEPIAELLRNNLPLRADLSVLWTEQWDRNNPEWKDRLKWLRCWLLPRGLKKPKDGETREQWQNRMTRCGAARDVGGLSLTRIATIKSFYQILKSYRMRPEPSDPRKNIPAKGDDSLRDFGRRILNVMEQMREQRVKQLASRIVEAALGIGSENKKKHWSKNPKTDEKTRRPRQRLYWVDQNSVEHGDKRFKQCDAVVIENLTNYRPEETRTRRENRQLMVWSSSKVKKYLTEGCQLHGLHLREVSAAYTSRQDSRTGAPGMRCIEITADEFLSSFTWRKQIRQAERKAAEKKGDLRDRLLLALFARYKGGASGDGKQRLIIPFKGGDLFISCANRSGKISVIQADLNAAANIGLRALLDPDFAGKWWYVPCDPKTREPKADKVKGGIFDGIGPLMSVPAENVSNHKTKAPKSKTREIINLWRDPSGEPVAASPNRPSWMETVPYWNYVQARIIRQLRENLLPDENPEDLSSLLEQF